MPKTKFLRDGYKEFLVDAETLQFIWVNVKQYMVNHAKLFTQQVKIANAKNKVCTGWT